LSHLRETEKERQIQVTDIIADKKETTSDKVCGVKWFGNHKTKNGG
jgi:hypothetical protein